MAKFIDPSEPIAIIGLGGVFPGAKDIPAYWRNILGKVDSIVEVPSDRWDWKMYYDPDPSVPHKTYSKIGGFIRDFTFDPLALRIPPPVAKQMDTVQQLAVVATAEALRDSGYETKPFDRERTAVVFGNSMGGPKKETSDLRVYTTSIQKNLAASAAFKRLPESARAAITAEIEESSTVGLCVINEDTMPGELSNVIAGRVANTFNLNGPNFTVDAACAASLAAVAQAVNGLRFRQFDMVITGGVDQMMAAPAYVKFCKIGALSATGSRPFDAGADGFVMGEGTGVLILKRLSDAVKDGDRIYALIRSIGASSDGRGKGITAPNPKGQRLAMERAFESLNYRPEDVGLLEAHGTSTKVGDVVEVQTAAEMFRSAAPGSIALGSVKSQIGHLKAAAGAASLVKTVLALHSKTLPPSINFKTPNPGIDWKACPFYVNTEAREWKSPGKPRRANVSAFGFGGTNFHMALEEAVPETTSWTPALPAVSEKELGKLSPPARPLAPSLGGEAFLVRGKDTGSILNRLERLKGEAPAAGPLTALADRVSAENPGGPKILAIAAESGPKLQEKIDLVLRSKDADVWKKAPPSFKPKGVHPGSKPAKRPKIAFMFPGQGSQYVDMLKDLREKYQVVADTFAEADQIMTPLIGRKLSDFIFTQGGESPEQVAAMQERIKQTEVTQPAVLTADVALLRLLRQYGVEPDVVCGHSLGEYGALVASGMMEFRDTLHAVSSRAKEMAGVKVSDPGKMASIAAPVEKVEALLKRIDGYVVAANKNCPIQTVIAGATRAVEEAVAMFSGEGIQAQIIEVSHAFHSQIVAPAQTSYGKFLERIQLKAPKIPILSNVTAGYYPKDVAAIRQLMVSQIAGAVEFIRQTRRMYEDGVRVFIEVGPKRALTAFVTSTLEEKDDVVVIPSNHPKRGGIHEFNDLLARLAAAGIEPDLSVPPEKLYTADYRAWCAAPAAPTAPAPTPAPSAPAAQPSAAEADLLSRWGIYLGPVVVSGISAGSPGKWDRVFRENAMDCIIDGQNLIEPIGEEERRKIVEKNLERVIKSETGDHRIERLESIDEVLRLAGQAGEFDIAKEFGVRASVSSLMDVTAKLSLAAAILALKDAGIPLVQHYKKTTTGGLIPTTWGLPDSLQEETGVILACGFPGYDSLIDDISRYFAAKYKGASARDLHPLYDRLIAALKDPADRKALTDWYVAQRASAPETGEEAVYKFSRSFLFRVLSLGHAQTAQFIKAKGPCTQVNAACASTTQAVGIAEDWIRLGRAKRVLILAADDITNPTLLSWLGTGFLSSGAATTHNVVTEAALPFDRRRNGMIIGMGAAGLVLEDGREAQRRGVRPLAELLAAQFDNSAYHVTRLNTRHVCETMERLVAKAEKRHGISRSAIAAKTLFMSHETYTPAQGGSSAAEVEALKHTFGPDTGKVVVTNTKGFTGHSMGASLEDVVAVRAMGLGRLPPIANYKEPDPNLAGITLSKGGAYDCEYALRLGAGFGSQIAMTLMRRLWRAGEPRIPDQGRYDGWVRSVSGDPEAQLEVVHNTLRVKDSGRRRAPRSEERPSAPRAPAVALPLPAAPANGNGSHKTETARPRPAADEAALTKEIVGLVSDKTGYPAQMLELDLDMEADLGIDTVKQAELIGLIREKYGIPRQENLTLKDYPTLRHVIRFVLGNVSASVPALAGAPAASAPAPARIPAPAPAGGLEEEGVRREIVALVSEKTGYPAEMLELDLDMEADLGIDTVKQAELIGLIREKYGIPRQENLTLKDYPTLRHVIRFVLGGGQPAGSAPAPIPASAAPQPLPAQAPARSGAGPSESAVQEEITALVSEKTGYPAQMLELDLDMEADLGIDTVKQAELIGLIREKYRIPRQENLTLKDYPTLRHVIRFVLENSGAQARLAPAEPSAPPKAGEGQFGRWVLDAYSRPAGGAPPALAQDRAVVLLSPDEETAKPFADSVAACGGTPVLVRSSDWADAEKAGAALRSALKKRPAQGLIDLTSLGLEPFEKLTAASFDKAYRKSARAFFLAAKALREDIQSSPSDSFVLSLTRAEGQPLSGSVAGLTKALRRELEGTRVQALEFDSGTPAEEMARLAVAELGSDDPRAEVAFRAGARQALRLTRRDLPEEGRRKLGSRSVVLITGGGQGLGAELAKEFARRYKCPLVLVGRTALVKEATTWARMSAEELKTLKMSMWEDLKKDKTRKATPALLEKDFSRITKAIDLQKNIEEMCRCGSKVLYLAADMADAGSVSKAVKAALRAHPAIDVVVHAAGLEESRLLADKKAEDFDRVVRAKAHGAFHLLKAVPATRNQVWAFFSSVTARFGNIGQTDYAAANDFLAKLAGWMRGQGRAAMTFDLTAFSEIGMATRGGVEAFLKAAGVDFMPPKTGVAMMLDEILRNAEDSEVVLAGALGKLDADGLMRPAGSLPAPQRAPAPKAAPPPPAALAKPAAGDAARTFSLESDPWLADHAISGVPYVPGVMGLELFADTAASALGRVPEGLRDVRFALPIKLLRNKPVTVRAAVKGAGADMELSLLTDFVNAAGIKLGGPRTHFTARPLTGGSAPAWEGLKKPALPKGGGFAVGAEAIYTAYFHGPSFQVLAGILSINEKETLALYRRPAAPLWPRGGPKLVFSPMLIEAAFQACGYRDHHVSKRMTLPDSIDSVRVFSHGEAPAELYVWTRYKGSDGPEKSVYDAYVYDASGRLWVSLEGYRMIAVS